MIDVPHRRGDARRVEDPALELLVVAAHPRARFGRELALGDDRVDDVVDLQRLRDARAEHRRVVERLDEPERRRRRPAARCACEERLDQRGELVGFVACAAERALDVQGLSARMAAHELVEQGLELGTHSSSHSRSFFALRWIAW